MFSNLILGCLANLIFTSEEKEKKKLRGDFQKILNYPTSFHFPPTGARERRENETPWERGLKLPTGQRVRKSKEI